MSEYMDFWIAKNIADIGLCLATCLVVGAVYVVCLLGARLVEKTRKNKWKK